MKQIVIDTEKAYELFSKTYFAMKDIQKADKGERIFGINEIRRDFCGYWNVINMLELRDAYYEWKHLCGFDEIEE